LVGVVVVAREVAVSVVAEEEPVVVVAEAVCVEHLTRQQARTQALRRPKPSVYCLQAP
jgi:hypothetical protein